MAQDQDTFEEILALKSQALADTAETKINIQQYAPKSARDRFVDSLAMFTRAKVSQSVWKPSMEIQDSPRRTSQLNRTESEKEKAMQADILKSQIGALILKRWEEMPNDY